MIENPCELWIAVKERCEKQKELACPEVEWNPLYLQDFKYVVDYNHVHTICSKMKFCEKDHIDAYKIEKTLSTMLLADRVL
jgi:hypothetical protein